MLNFTGNQSVGGECSQVVVLSLIDIFTVLIGLPLNAKMLWITSNSKKSLDVLNINLALFHNLQYFISTLHLIFLLSALQNSQQISNFLLVYVQIGGPMNLSFICMERYVAVIHPTSYPLLRKYRIRELCAVTVWLSSLPTALFIALNRDTLSTSDGALSILPSSAMLVMGAAMVWCSLRIARALKKSSPGRDKLHPVKKRAFRVVCATSVVTVCCYLPVNAIQAQRELIDMCMKSATCLLFLSVASFVHSVLYLSTHLKLLVHLKALCNAKN